MKSTIGERLKEFISYKKLTLEKFGDAFEATKGEVNNWCSGTKITVNRLGHMSKAYPDLNIHWLLIGEPHEMLNKTIPANGEIREPESPYNVVENNLREAISIIERLKKETETR